jgi:hypothetical protein
MTCGATGRLLLLGERRGPVYGQRGGLAGDGQVVVEPVAARGAHWGSPFSNSVRMRVAHFWPMPYVVLRLRNDGREPPTNLGTSRLPAGGQVRTQCGSREVDGPAVGVKAALRRVERAVSGDLPEHVQRDPGIRHPRQARVPEIVTA